MALLTALCGVAASLGIGYLLGLVTGHTGRPRSRVVSIIQHMVLGENATLPRMVPHWVQSLVGLLMAVSLLGALLVRMRSQRIRATTQLPEELEVRKLLAENPSDSLGYFATRRDKQLVFSAGRRAAVACRVELGVCLAAGDPVGRQEYWAEAIDAYLELCHAYGWTPGVVGASEDGAAPWSRRSSRRARRARREQGTAR